MGGVIQNHLLPGGDPPSKIAMISCEESVRLQLVERRVVVARSGVGARGGPGWTRIAVTSGGEAFFFSRIFSAENKQTHTKKPKPKFQWVFLFVLGGFYSGSFFWMLRIDMNGFCANLANKCPFGEFTWPFERLERWPTQGLRGSRLVTVIEQCSRAPGCLFDMGDYTTQLYIYIYKKPL